MALHDHPRFAPLPDSRAEWGEWDGASAEVLVATATTEAPVDVIWTAEVVAKAGNRIERWATTLGLVESSASATLHLALPDASFGDVLAQGHFVHVHANLQAHTVEGRVVQQHQLPPRSLGRRPDTGERVLWTAEERAANTEFGTFATLDPEVRAALEQAGPHVVYKPWIPATVVIAEDDADVEARIAANPGVRVYDADRDVRLDGGGAL